MIPEVPRIIIEEQNASGGDLVPWKKMKEFNEEMTRRQQEFEATATDEVHFLDRGVIDGLAYCEFGRVEPPQILVEAASTASYDKIFLLLPLPHYENDEVRKESKEDQTRLHGLIKKAYESQGYRVIEVPPWSVEKRVEFILGHTSVSE